MLKTRILTALVLIPLLLAALFWLPNSMIAVLFGAIIAIGAWEWGTLTGFRCGQRIAYAASIMVLGVLAVTPIEGTAEGDGLKRLRGPRKSRRWRDGEARLRAANDLQWRRAA